MSKIILRLFVLSAAIFLTGCYTTYVPAIFDLTNLVPEPWPCPGRIITPCLPVSVIKKIPAPLEIPQRVYVLVPLHGKLSYEGRAFIRGFFRAFKRASWFCRPALIYAIDTCGAPCIMAPYNQALLSCADFIVGPFSAAETDQLNATNNIPIPTLTLHYLSPDQKPAVNLYQFGLPEGWQQTCRTRNQRAAKFYALGIDAYWATVRLGDLLIQDKINGMTGCLYLNCCRQVVRTSACCSYDNGPIMSLNEVDMDLSSVDLTTIPALPTSPPSQ